jgi:hypothetical protein
MASRDAIGNTRTMTASPPPTRYHRWLGWYAPAMRRTVIVSSVGLAFAVVLLWFLPWGMAVVAGWDAAALTFLVSIWPIILRADGTHAAQLAMARTRPAASQPRCWLGRAWPACWASASPSTLPGARAGRFGCC